MNLVEFARPSGDSPLEDTALDYPEFAPNPPLGSLINLQDIRDERRAAELSRGASIAIFWIAEAQEAKLVNTEPDLQVVHQRAGEAGLIKPNEAVSDMKVLLARVAIESGMCEPGSETHKALAALGNYDATVKRAGSVIYDKRLTGNGTELRGSILGSADNPAA